MYQGIQNVVVKLTPKGTTSENYILVNSHFDSQPTSPSTGDDGHMVVSILEVLRVISSTRKSFEHPIVFLINGSEKIRCRHLTDSLLTTNGLRIATGSGGRELMFQSGPNYPWLVKIYKDGAKHYFSTTMAEEIFQTGLVPSYTDFDIFVEYGNLIGLDIGQCINGFVYHTKYDRIDVIPRAALRNTGDNLLGLVQTLSNASELRDLSANPTGNTIFFDVLGLYLISFSSDVGVKLNYAAAAAAIILIYISLLRIAEKSSVSSEQILSTFILVLVAPFMYNSYLFYCFIVILTPMMGRFGVDTNPDLIIGALTALGTILSMGFLQVRRVFYEYDGTVSKDESGYLFNVQDRRGLTPLLKSNMDLTGLVNMTSDCAKYMMCGMPLYDHRWVESVQMEFELETSDHTRIFIDPNEDVIISDWSFLKEYLTTNSPPYHIYYSFGIDNTPLRFRIVLKKADGDFTVPLFQMGISTHYMHVKGDDESIRFANSIPDFAVSIQWPAMYKKYIF
ncbi:GM21956 [Drosophila sechellia]|uniref:FXNA-like protease n=1 Tax=Drosophila sechellia TaxID=7238 RepID=B4HPF4_DROSE|nr:GM21956 [Drosophila sechellia]